MNTATNITKALNTIKIDDNVPRKNYVYPPQEMHKVFTGGEYHPMDYMGANRISDTELAHTLAISENAYLRIKKEVISTLKNQRQVNVKNFIFGICLGILTSLITVMIIISN